MKRFFCTTCRKIKRVHTLPDNVVGVSNERPADRVGRCVYHSSSLSRRQTNDRRSMIPKPTQTKRTSAPTPAPVAKKPAKKQSRAQA